MGSTSSYVFGHGGNGKAMPYGPYSTTVIAEDKVLVTEHVVEDVNVEDYNVYDVKQLASDLSQILGISNEEVSLVSEETAADETPQLEPEKKIEETPAPKKKRASRKVQKTIEETAE